ncbi:MAG TPA: hypothetical protein RMH99_03000 [Sandaracinaceae bacterium LLY-WYZ-13_1]|nr:hypothetical protein [Sandaracinaceae bacterium LLY-WYZ-13_1]
MGLLSKLADATRAKWNELERMRIGDKPLAELTDAELEAELQRRRRKRGYAPGRGASASSRGGRAPGWKVRQWYRSLELEPGASRDAVEEAYARLSKKYDPERYDDDAEKRRVAVKLLAGLGEAYYGLRDHFEAE